MSLFKRYFLFSIFFLLFGCFAFAQLTPRLSRVSDTISTSWPATGADHLIRFTLTTGIPASGRIIVTPQEGVFYIPSMNHTDLRLFINGSQRNLGSLAGPGVSGVEIISGLEGRITIILASDLNTLAGDEFIIEIGRSVENRQIVNPAATGSYQIRLQTFNNLGGLLDIATAMIAILDPIQVGTDVIRENPIIRTLPAYLSDPNTAALFGALINLGTNQWVDIFFQYRIKGSEIWQETPRRRREDAVIYTELLAAIQEDTIYEFRSAVEWLMWTEEESRFDLTNIFGEILEFPKEEVIDDDEESTNYPPPPPPGVPPPSGVPANPPPPDPLRPPPYLIFEGWAFPNQTVTLLKNGEVFLTTLAESNSEFNFRINEPFEGIFDFTLQSKDGEDRLSADIFLTIEASPNKVVRISNIIFAPTIELNQIAVIPGDFLEVFGITVPNGILDINIIDSSGEEFLRSTVADLSGRWSLVIDDLTEDRYRIRARTIIFEEESGFSRVLSFAIGVVCLPADLNCDGSVDLIDFSILMFYWGTSDPRADINGDGRVDIIDFSIMMAYWTG